MIFHAVAGYSFGTYTLKTSAWLICKAANICRLWISIMYLFTSGNQRCFRSFDWCVHGFCCRRSLLLFPNRFIICNENRLTWFYNGGSESTTGTMYNRLDSLSNTYPLTINYNLRKFISGTLRVPSSLETN